MQNDPHRCKIKLENFQFDILCCYGVIKESLPEGGAETVPPPRWDRVNPIWPGLFEPSVIWGGGGGHHNFVVIAPMIMKFGTGIKPNVL